MYLYPIAVLFAFDLWDLAAAFNDCRPKDCYDLKCYRVSKAKDGPHTIYPDTPDLTETGLNVSCDQETDGGGWIMYQRRLDGTVNFTRTFEEYKRHFGQHGDNMTELWLGNENVYQVLQSYGTTECELRIEVDAWDEETCWLVASNFRIGDEYRNYTLDWDNVISSHPDTESNWDLHKLLSFRTFEDENKDCVREYRGGWWYSGQDQCVKVYLNGRYVNEAVTTWNSIMIFNFRSLSLKRSRMMLRPTNDNRLCNNPCKNGGTCEHVAYRSHCACTSDWCGATCEAKNPCNNGGNCEVDQLAMGDYRTLCTCTPDWCGVTCDLTNPCNNGGICKAVYEDLGFRAHCACTPGWCGETCDLTNPCINGGVCEATEDSVSGYHAYCACTSEWCGVRCEVKSLCMNGGTCEAYPMTCKCAAGFAGQTCEDVIREITTSVDTTGGDTTSGDTTSEDTTSVDTTGGDTTSEDTTSEDTTSEDTTSEDTTSDETTSEHTTGDGVPSRNTTDPILKGSVQSSGAFDYNNGEVVVAVVILLRRLFGFFGF